MNLLLNPWLLLVLVVALAGTHFTAYRKGKQDVRNEWQVAVASANEEARRLEQRRQSMVDEAARGRAARESRLSAAVARGRNESDGLRNDLSATREWAAQSRAAADEAIRVTTGLFEQCTALYLSVAEDAARADSEARELRQAWPK